MAAHATNIRITGQASHDVSLQPHQLPIPAMEHVSRKQLELYADLKSRGSQLQSDKDLLHEVSQLLEHMQKLQIETAYSDGEASSPPTADSQASAPCASEASSTSTTISAAARALAYYIADERANDMSSAAGKLFTMALSMAMDGVEEKKEKIEQEEYIPTSSKKRELFFRRTGQRLDKAQADVHSKCLGVAEISERSGGGVEGDVEVARRVVEVLGDLVKMMDGRREALEALSKLDEM
ncbi:hypothetical protein AC578_2835 [Pseudocercospora eumusae]|uniref:Uncharacterized protein n=1 Tax=Pseudocercospora eumusae TaxID=321146 RepID=A0A139H428_9PEZI|nr:hypothetical protein AC578_2835 [Pseudocercospora eumusae]